MTLAQLRTSTRNLLKQWSTETGTLLPADNARLDDYLSLALEMVVTDLMQDAPEVFLDYEDITLVANTSEYGLTKEYAQIWDMKRMVDGWASETITYLDRTDDRIATYIGETAEHPKAYTLKGDTIIFLPTPSTAKTDYARCWIVELEATTIAAGGPAMLPRLAHRLIVFRAGVIIRESNGKSASVIENLYQFNAKQVKRLLMARVQHQTKFLKGRQRSVGTQDPALHDYAGDAFFRRG